MTNRIYSIDSLRAVAMTMVIAQHCGLLPFGWTGVWLFYVISGFVISRTLIHENLTSAFAPSGHYLSFLMRRIFRIIPPYAAYIGLCLMVALVIELPPQVRELPYLASFTYNWRMIFAADSQSRILGHLWTISVEEQFYILAPWLILLLRRERAIIGLVAVVALGPLARSVLSDQLAAFYADPGRLAFGVYASSIGHFDAFALGSLLAHFEGHVRRSPQIATRLLRLAIAVLVVYVATYAYLNIRAGAHGIDIVRNLVSGILFGQKREVFVYVAVDLCAVAIIAGAVAGWRAFKVLEHPALVAVGQFSYGGYLLHPLALLIIHQFLGSMDGKDPIYVRLLIFGLAWSATVIVARGSYLMFERRIIRYGHEVSNGVLTRARASAAQ